MKLRSGRRLRILSFDIENRPLSYAGSDWTSADITAIAAGWSDEDEIGCRVLTKDQRSARQMLAWFRRLYDEADIVTGHYIRKHDLPILNGAMMEFGLPLLTSKLTSDTYLDLTKRKDLSASQQALGDILDLDAPKEGMSQEKWRRANRLIPSGIEETKRRVIGDVRQHRELRAALLERGWLKPPKAWRP